MRRLAILVTFLTLLLAFLLLGISDTSVSFADTTIPDNEVGASVGEVDNCDPAMATIMITMYAVAEE